MLEGIKGILWGSVVVGFWIYFGLSHAIIGVKPPLYTQDRLSPWYWMNVIYVST